LVNSPNGNTLDNFLIDVSCKSAKDAEQAERVPVGTPRRPANDRA
jgi:hypothetical protein